MDTKKLICLAIAVSLLAVGCGTPEVKKSTPEEIESFKGKPLTPEQVSKLRGSMGGGGGPAAAGPKAGGPPPPSGN